MIGCHSLHSGQYAYLVEPQLLIHGGAFCRGVVSSYLDKRQGGTGA